MKVLVSLVVPVILCSYLMNPPYLRAEEGSNSDSSSGFFEKDSADSKDMFSGLDVGTPSKKRIKSSDDGENIAESLTSSGDSFSIRDHYNDNEATSKRDNREVIPSLNYNSSPKQFEEGNNSEDNTSDANVERPVDPAVASDALVQRLSESRDQVSSYTPGSPEYVKELVDKVKQSDEKIEPTKKQRGSVTDANRF